MTFDAPTPAVLHRERFIRRRPAIALVTPRSDIAVELSSHALPGMKADAAARVDAVMRLAIEKRTTKGVG
jgi:hypothetical protein